MSRENTEQSNTRAVDDFLEAEAGCAYHRALVAADMQGACERFVHEFEHDEDDVVVQLVAICRNLMTREIKLEM